MWTQKELRLPAKSRGYHLVTREIVEAVPEISSVRVGWLQVFIQHTSASLTINENADPDVLDDLDRVLDHVVPESFAYHHTCEGPDDMPAHGKTSLLGCSLTVPVGAGGLKLGTWQGICLCEHRNHGGRRRLVLTLFGQ
jgi:secondary thiamine-phosphate synthase enzyme